MSLEGVADGVHGRCILYYVALWMHSIPSNVYSLYSQSIGAVIVMH